MVPIEKVTSMLDTEARDSIQLRNGLLCADSARYNSVAHFRTTLSLGPANLT